MNPGLLTPSLCLLLPIAFTAEALCFDLFHGLWTESSCLPCGSKSLQALSFGVLVAVDVSSVLMVLVQLTSQS